MTQWKAWQRDGRIIRSPYVHWEWGLYGELEGLETPSSVFAMLPAVSDLGSLDSADFKDNARNTDPQAFTAPPVPDLRFTSRSVDDREVNEGSEVKDAEDLRLNVFPCPRNSSNPRYESVDFLMDFFPAGRSRWLGSQELNSALEPDDIVVGIVDIDIGLGHHRFRRNDGATRVLAAWQQGAPWLKDAPEYMPFGQELSEARINELLRKHSGGKLEGSLDQHGFYSELGLLAPHDVTRLGPLAGRIAHGTHVLGLLAGADPDDPQAQDFMKRVKLLVVNLPPPVFFGQGGAFLDYYISFGLDWIRNTHANLVSRLKTNPPLVTNISFGKLAGAGDRRQSFVDVVRDDDAAQDTWIFMPAGNDNLERCHAEMRLEDEVQEVSWIIQPDDETSNFLEVWTEREFSQAEVKMLQGTPPLLLDVVVPGSAEENLIEAAFPEVTLSGSQRRDLANAEGRIYCEWVGAPAGDGSAGVGQEKSYRFRYLVCLTSDAQNLKAPLIPAPAGPYRVRVLRNRAAVERLSAPDEMLLARLLIQTDTATLPYRRHARRSYFEDANYKRFDCDGRASDVQSVVANQAGAFADFDSASIIRRRGTMNSYALNDAVEAIAGYRRSDGMPAPYSANGREISGVPVNDKLLPRAALPSDDGYAHFGLLSDGAQNGSKVALRGTSFASASAARLMVDALLIDGQKNGTPADTVDDVFRDALASPQETASWRPVATSTTKVGIGRLSARHTTRVPRL